MNEKLEEMQNIEERGKDTEAKTMSRVNEREK